MDTVFINLWKITGRFSFDGVADVEGTFFSTSSDTSFERAAHTLIFSIEREIERRSLRHKVQSAEYLGRVAIPRPHMQY
jgi:hypothetical protein